MKSVLLIALLLLPSTVRAQDTIDPKPILAFIAGSSFDMATTLYALNSSPNVREGNPFLQVGGTPGLVIVKSAATAAVALEVYRLMGHGHPTAAKVLGYAGGIALSGLALHNLRVLQDAQTGVRR